MDEKTLVYKKRFTVVCYNVLCYQHTKQMLCCTKEISSFAIIVFGEQSICYAKNSKCIIII